MTPDTAAMFARVRANAEKACFEAGDLFEIMQTVTLAERAVIGEGEQLHGLAWMHSMLSRNGVQLPLKVGLDGDIFDAVGVPVIQIDPNRERSDDRVAEIATVVTLAINTCAGFAPRAAVDDILPASTNSGSVA